jgi:hypothetical protein
MSPTEASDCLKKKMWHVCSQLCQWLQSKINYTVCACLCQICFCLETSL